MPRPPRNANEIVIISWRDIPAQVTGRQGETRHQVLLPHRFQKAIDRAAMVADKKTAQEYVGEWQRSTRSFEGDVAEAAEAIAAEIDTTFTNERLHQLVANGGYQPTEQDPS